MSQFNIFSIIRLISLLTVIPTIWFAAARTSPNLKVQLSHGGILVGRLLTTFNGRHMRAFMGIPYAQPPLNDLRFKAPVPYGSWKGEKLVVQDSNKCIQRDPFRRDEEISGSEDCLYLNVYTPEKTNINELLPVMVWFHGGGWQCGSGISSFYGPDFLLDHDIILVTVNYRLGPIGFLSTETLDCPGNFGLKDQLEALKWIQSHIEKFSGNPQSVTIFGESAGGASVTYHMMSKQSKGLFHKAIAQSGTYFNPWAQPAYKGVPSQRAKKAAILLNCYNQTTTESDSRTAWPDILKCLRKKDAKDIVETVYKLFTWDTDPMIPYPPVVEPNHKEAFITNTPREVDQLPSGSIPLMIGVTSEEGLLKTAALLNLPDILADFKNHFDKALPVLLYYDHLGVTEQSIITQKLRDFYLKDGLNFNKHNHENITNLISDGWFLAGFDEYLRKRVETVHNVDTYVYLFEHKSSASFTEIFYGGLEEFYGTCHADELQYLFPLGKELFTSAVPTESDLKLRHLMIKLWVNFAYYGNPTPTTTKLAYSDQWLPTNNQYPANYAHIGHTNKSQNSDHLLHYYSGGFYNDRFDFWHKLRPHVPASQFKHDEL